ncbi:MAG: 23S rRNA (guanosine(2251)-2'-O)-methyltransferase RlmB [Anaerolineales bacterium]
MNREWVYGRNAVREVLRANRRKTFRLYIQDGVQEKSPIPEIRGLAKKINLPISSVPRSQLDQIAHGHQGVALETETYLYSDVDAMILLARNRQEDPFILILDVIQDPQNMGSLLRTAEGVGVHGVILPYRETVGITPAVVNSSAGASEYLLIARNNLAQVIACLKKQDVWVIGLEDVSGAVLPAEVRVDRGVALVVGGEGSGIRQLVRRSCDVLMRLPMRGKINSYNAAVAGSIALYSIAEKRGLL